MLYPLRIVGDEHAEGVGWIGLALIVVGVALGGWAMLAFRRAKTATIPFYPASALVQRGPYRFSRNPMYVALAVAYVGAALLLNTPWPLFLLPLVLVVLYATVIRPEERYLLSAFPEDYAAYRARVRRWL